MAAKNPLLSVIVPAFNERENIFLLYKEIKKALWGISYEVIFVDDGSIDGTDKEIQKITNKDKSVKSIHFRKNFGQTAAFSAGLGVARAKLIAFLDSDLQNDPADLPRLLTTLNKTGADVIAGWRKDREDPINKIIPSKIANWIIGKVTGIKLHDYGCSLKLFKAEVLSNINLYGEMHRFLPAYAAMYGAKIAEVPVNHRPRTWGKTKYGIIRTVKVLLDLLTVKFFDRFLTKPLYAFGFISLVCFVAALVSLVYLILIKIQGFSFIQSPVLLLGAIAFTLAITFLGLGILAELIIRIYYESQGKRPYVVRSTRNLPPRLPK